jgi:hypothetical protein
MYRVQGTDLKEYGPVTEKQVLEWIAENRLNAFSMAQKEGDPEWRPLSQYPEFTSALQAQPALPPPLASAATAPDPQRAARLLQGPSLALLLMGTVGLVITLSGFVARDWLVDALLRATANFPAAVPSEQLGLWKTELSRDLTLRDYVRGLAGVVINGVMIAGALAMRRLENRNLALAAATFALIPCQCCCCVSIPFGVWALLMLNRPEVKQSFR